MSKFGPLNPVIVSMTYTYGKILAEVGTINT